MDTLQGNIDLLRLEKPILIKDIIKRQMQLQPEFQQYNRIALQHALNDAQYNLEYLFSAIGADSKLLFEHYSQWTNQLFDNLKIPKDTLGTFYRCAQEVFTERFAQGLLNEELFQKLIEYLISGTEAITSNVLKVESSLNKENPLKDLLAIYSERVFSGDRNSATRFIKELSNQNIDIKDIYKYILQPFQLELGNLWHENKITVAQEHYATAISQVAMSMLYEKIFAIPKKGKTLLGTCIQGELHEFGIRMICDYMESCSWDTYYLGANVPNIGIIDMIHEKSPHVVAISCTMIFNLSQLQKLVHTIKQHGIVIPIIVGGYPFNLDKDLWQKMGADGYSRDFEDVYLLAEKLSGDSKNENF